MVLCTAGYVAKTRLAVIMPRTHHHLCEKEPALPHLSTTAWILAVPFRLDFRTLRVYAGAAAAQNPRTLWRMEAAASCFYLLRISRTSGDRALSLPLLSVALTLYA